MRLRDLAEALTMGIVSWVRNLWGGEPATATEQRIASEISEISEHDAEVAGLNFLKAIEAHMKWRARLEAVIAGTSGEKLEVATVAKNDVCVLGQWLYGPGAAHSTFTGFAELEQLHTAFHKSAAEILLLAQTGRQREATRLLAGDYRATSVKIGGLLAQLHKHAKQRQEKPPATD